jgi:hypothetical protein
VAVQINRSEVNTMKDVAIQSADADCGDASIEYHGFGLDRCVIIYPERAGRFAYCILARTHEIRRGYGFAHRDRALRTAKSWIDYSRQKQCDIHLGRAIDEAREEDGNRLDRANRISEDTAFD